MTNAAKLLVSACLAWHTLPVAVSGQQRQSIKLDLNDLGGLGDLLGGLAGAGQQKKDGSCPSVCGEDQPDFAAAPKSRIRPYSNGCSVPGSMREGLGDYSHFEPCCDLHDTCYMSCGVHKQFCENEFGKCMRNVCSKKFASAPERRQQCKSMADLFMTGTTMFGCGGYTDLQKHGCECLDPREAEQRVNQYAREFYEQYNRTHALPDMIVEKYLAHNHKVATKKREMKHGELLYRLYKKYPQSIDVIARDGKSARHKAVYFSKNKKKTEF